MLNGIFRSEYLMKIGNIKLENNVVLAPMAGVTDLAFRLLVKEMGCGLVYSEMVSNKGLLYKNENTADLLATDPRERPAAMQIFGSDPKCMAEAAKMVTAGGADIVDINMGCPTPKIVKNGDGSALMQKPELAYRIMNEVCQAVDVPVTVKFRSGWDDTSLNAVEIARLAQKAGIAAVAVHGRTRAQFYAGKADWNIIKEVKESVSIPVIGNGDVRSPEDAKNMLDFTGCDGVMIGRAAEGNPWIFRQVVNYLATGEIVPPPTLEERLSVIKQHLEMLISYKGEYIGIREMRKHGAWYTKGLPYAAELRLKFNQACTRQDFLDILENMKEQR
jgi:tRNA-dihydrouridine synthase B